VGFFLTAGFLGMMYYVVPKQADRPIYSYRLSTVHFWVRFQPMQRLSSNWLPLRRWPQGFALGLCWGLMPCGLIYSSLAWAATA
jgi:cbb3-type cytochrome oxidase subunit 1